jgi:RNase P/RNase MRP subunit POP5
MRFKNRYLLCEVRGAAAHDGAGAAAAATAPDKSAAPRLSGLSARLAEIRRDESSEAGGAAAGSQSGSSQAGEDAPAQPAPGDGDPESLRRVTSAAFLRAIRKSVERHFGMHGLAVVQTALQVKYFNPITGVAVVRCAREQVRTVWAALTLIETISCHPGRRGSGPSGPSTNVCVAIRVLHNSGTIKLCQEAAVKHDTRLLLAEELRSLGDAAELIEPDESDDSDDET